MTETDRTHDAGATSWVQTANGEGDFPLQNLPFAVFRRKGQEEPFRGGVAIGDSVLDLAALGHTGLLADVAAQGARACDQAELNAFFAMGRPAWKALRHALFDLLHSDAGLSERRAVQNCLVPQSEVEYDLPARIGDYTDFYTSIDHATNIVRLFKPDAPVAPNFQWIPLGYHGRVSSIGMSGQMIRRPMGQTLPEGATRPVYGPSSHLDYELELGIYIGQGNAQGEAIALDDAEDHIFGICLLNDWSARDIQRWESTPLGPFLAKNFGTTLSPWIVTLEALAPFRLPWVRAADAPQPLAYLDSERTRASGAIDIHLEVWLETPSHRQAGEAGERLSTTSFRHQYWTIGQMVAHHATGGCNLRSGDLIGSGTISGPGDGEAGALIELSRGGRSPVRLANGERREFLQDGDAITLTGWCEKPGFARIGFGKCTGVVAAARTP